MPEPQAQRLRVCLVKQHTTYDLYTKTGPDLETILSSSNWRTGPLGLWEAFDCDFRVVYESPDHECQIGKTHWARYVEGWDIWPEGSVAEQAESIDWSSYDIVISVDVAIPTRIVVEYPRTMWCYFFIERGPFYRGSPYFYYNVFFNHDPARSIIDISSPCCRKMSRVRRAIIDFPYYMISSHTIRNIYGKTGLYPREGIMMSHHSHQTISPAERLLLESVGVINRSGTRLTDVHRDALRSEYCVVHPATRRMSGLALVEAISAGCIALAPLDQVVTFPDVLYKELDYSDFTGLLRVLERLQSDENLRAKVREHQTDCVDEYFYSNPKKNLECIYRAFRESKASAKSQAWSQRRDGLVADALNLSARVRGRATRALRRAHPMVGA